jgi:hypothetical protein
MMNRLMAHCSDEGLSRATAIQFALDRYLDRYEVKEGK